jgi:cytochrome c-type biogenesis protein CcmH/NrfG
MEKLVILLMAPPFMHHSINDSSFGSLIMLFIIFTIPLSWVIPYIVRKNRNKQTPNRHKNSTARDQIEQLKDLAKLKEQGILTEEEFIAQKNKVLGRG